MSGLALPAADAPASEWGRLAALIPGWRAPDDDLPSFWFAAIDLFAPDPDHWAWEGWLLRMLGPGWYGQYDEDGWELWACQVGRVGAQLIDAPTLGRACIAAAAALGRWPGGAK